MQISNIPNVYLAIGAGIVIWLIGQTFRSNEALGKIPMNLAKFLSYVGLVVFAVGMYAGFKGPLTIAGVTLATFPVTKTMAQSNAEALMYANSFLDISRTPAVGWHGASKTMLQYTVKNNGATEIRSMVVHLSTSDGSSVDLPLDGPFPGKKTTTSLVEIPSQVRRSYFTNAKAAFGEVISAR